MRLLASSLLVMALAASSALAACQGCHAASPNSAADADSAQAKPTVRLYLLSTVAGALEPCGCSKDQLGGIDHAAAYIESQKDAAPNSLVLSAGPLLFSDPSIKGDETTQASWKAEAIAFSAKEMGLLAWAPGANDWAASGDGLNAYREQAGATILGANLDGTPKTVPLVVREIGGVKIGIVGVSDPKSKIEGYPAGVTA